MLITGGKLNFLDGSSHAGIAKALLDAGCRIGYGEDGRWFHVGCGKLC